MSRYTQFRAAYKKALERSTALDSLPFCLPVAWHWIEKHVATVTNTVYAASLSKTIRTLEPVFDYLGWRGRQKVDDMLMMGRVDQTNTVAGQ